MNKGFTLMELLVVVLIIGILASIAMPQYLKAVKKAKAVEAWTHGKALADAENVFYMRHGYYTSDLSRLDIEIPSLNNVAIGDTYASGSNFTRDLIIGSGSNYVRLSYRLYDGKLSSIYFDDNERKTQCQNFLPCSNPSIWGNSSGACYF